MTNAQVLLRTVGLADAWLEHTLEVVEIDLRDSGATLEEIENAVGPGGFMGRVLEADRDQQIAEVEKWLAGKDNTLN